MLPSEYHKCARLCLDSDRGILQPKPPSPQIVIHRFTVFVLPTNANQDRSDPATTWAVRISVALVFALTGVEKFLPGSARYWAHVFDAIGFGQWFRYFTGAVEIVGGLFFPVPRTTALGAGLLAATMAGAMATQAFVLKHPADGLFPGLYLVGVVVAFLKLRTARRVA
jgi:putative oxidoreductase